MGRRRGGGPSLTPIPIPGAVTSRSGRARTARTGRSRPWSTRARRRPGLGPFWNIDGHAVPSAGLPWCGPSVFLSVPITVTSMVLAPGWIHFVTSHAHGADITSRPALPLTEHPGHAAVPALQLHAVLPGRLRHLERLGVRDALAVERMPCSFHGPRLSGRSAAITKPLLGRVEREVAEHVGRLELVVDRERRRLEHELVLADPRRRARCRSCRRPCRATTAPFAAATGLPLHVMV